MYSKISSIYNKFLWTEFSQELFERLEVFLYKWKVNYHLDIACGTGDFIFLVNKAGISSSGIDVSKEMIREARLKYPTINCRVSDMRNFKVKKKVDLITCNFDSINHLLKFRDWEETFQSVYNNLNDKGKFLFDMNTLNVILNYRDDVRVQMDEDVMTFKTSPIKNNILVFNIKAKVNNKTKNNNIIKTIKETSFEYKKIKGALKDIGFRRVIIFNKHLGIKNVKKRLYILAEK